METTKKPMPKKEPELKISITRDSQLKFSRYITTSFNLNGTHISCGVYQIHNIDSLNSFINYCNKYKNAKAKIVEKMQELIAKIKEDQPCAFLIASTTKDQIEVCRIFDKLAVRRTPFKKNENSGNLIKVWVL